MRVVERAAQLDRREQHAVERQRAVLLREHVHQAPHVGAVHVLHHVVVLARRLDDIDHAHDVRVIEHRGDACLLAKPLDGGGIGRELRAQALQDGGTFAMTIVQVDQRELAARMAGDRAHEPVLQGLAMEPQPHHTHPRCRRGHGHQTPR